MSGNSTKEYLMSLLDEAKRCIIDDKLGEVIEPCSYSIEENTSKDNAPADFYAACASCHSCQMYSRREVFARPLMKSGNVMFILPYPDGNMLLDGDDIQLFRSWWKDSILLREGEWSLTSLIKCPAGTWSREAADACRGYLRDEMMAFRPSAMVILSSEASRYMLRSSCSFADMLGHEYKVNGIRTFVSYSPSEYRADPSLRVPLWKNFLFIRKALGLEGRNA